MTAVVSTPNRVVPVYATSIAHLISKIQQIRAAKDRTKAEYLWKLLCAMCKSRVYVYQIRTGPAPFLLKREDVIFSINHKNNTIEISYFKMKPHV